MGRSTIADDQLEELTSALMKRLTEAATAAGGKPRTSKKRKGDSTPAPSSRAEKRAEDKPAKVSGIKSFAHRNKSALRPWQLAALAAATAGVLNVVGTVVGQPGLVAVLAATAATAAAALVGWRIRAKIPAGWWPWAVAAAADAIAWLTAYTAVGWTYDMLVWWLASTALFGLRWWAHVRRPYPAAAPGAAATQVTVDRGTDDEQAIALVANYNANVASEGQLADSRLEEVKPYKFGLDGILVLVPGKQSIATVRAQLAKISTGIGYYPEEIIADSDRALPPNKVRFRVATRSPIKETRFFDRPRYADGIINLGPYADGIGSAGYVLYRDNSMESGYLLGSKGSGKSRLLELIALTALYCTPTVLLYLDGQDGASSPLLWEHAMWRGGPRDARDFLQGLLGLKDYRQAYNRYHRLTGFTPADDLPGVLVVIDESHRIFTNRTADLWAELAREFRKLGVGILASSQDTTLKAFGGSDVLRSSLVSGNGLAMRTASAVQAQVFPGLSVDLTSIPALPGYCYTIALESQGGRTAPFRAPWLVDTQSVTKLGLQLPGGISTAEQWLAEVAPRQHFDDGSARALGPAFARRHLIAAAQQAELDAMFAGGGVSEALFERITRRAAIRVLGNTAKAGTAGQPGAAPASGPGVATTAQVVAFPAWPPADQDGDDQDGDPADAQDGGTPAEHKVTEAQSRVLAAAADGATAQEIAASLGVSVTRAYEVAGQLVDAGLLVKDGTTYLPA